MFDVLYFDYWTRGVRHFSKVNEYIEASGLSSALVHLGSQRGEAYCEEQIISGVRAIDLKLFQYDFVKMLKTYKPKIILLLNNQTEDRIITRACRELGIKTVYLMHGVLSPENKVEESIVLVNSLFNLSDRIKRVPKYTRLFSQYIRAAVLGGIWKIFDPEIYIYFFRHAYSPGGNLAGKWKYRDGIADYALVYSKTDALMFNKCMSYEMSNISVVGNYNLDDLYSLLQIERPSKEKYVLYIENGFSNPNYSWESWSEELVADEVVRLAKICGDMGYKFILKLHPSSDYSILIERVKNIDNLEVVLHCDLAKLVISSSCVLGQSSSVIMMALVANIPVIILDIPPLLLTITTYSDSGVGFQVKSYNEFQTVLEDICSGNKLHLTDPIKSEALIGPFDGMSTRRIADFIIESIM